MKLLLRTFCALTTISLVITFFVMVFMPSLTWNYQAVAANLLVNAFFAVIKTTLRLKKESTA